MRMHGRAAGRLRTTCLSMLAILAACRTASESSTRAYEVTVPSPAPAAGGDTTPEERVASPPPAVQPGAVDPERERVRAAPGRTYRATAFQRLVLGDLNRHLWDIEFSVPVLDLDSVGGGLVVTELSGGKQTVGLRFRGRDGQEYQFRSIVKEPGRALPEGLRGGPVEDLLHDQQGAQFPLAALVVAELLEAADVLVAKPSVVVMPDDPRLGEFREAFAGRMGWIEVRPDETESGVRGFAGSEDVQGTPELFADLAERPEVFVDTRKLVRARLIDMFVNDWDRHADNWRWAGYTDDSRHRYEPVPRDRDWAFARIDGVLPELAGIIYPRYTSFGEAYPNIKRLMWAGSVVDRRLLGGVDRSTYREEVAELQEVFTDSVIDAAIGVLPPEYQAVEMDRLRSSLRQRRESLPHAAEEYYAFLAKWVDLYGTAEADSVHLATAGDSVQVGVWRGEERIPAFARTFHRQETEEIRLYLLSGHDVVTVDGEARFPMHVCLIGEPGSVELIRSTGSITLEEDGTVPDSHDLSFHEASSYLPQEDTTAAGGEGEGESLPPAPTFAWEKRDWGSQWLAHPAAHYESDFGLHLGMKVTRLSFGFGQDPYESRLDMQLLGSTNPWRAVGRAVYERKIGMDGLSARFQLDASTERHSRFFGFGNDSRDVAAEEFYTGFRSHMVLDASLVYSPPDARWSVWAGPRLARWGVVDHSDVPVVFQSESVYGSDAFAEYGLQGGLEIDNRDDADSPHRGMRLLVEGRAFPETGNLRAAHAGVSGRLGTYWDLPGPLDPVLHVSLYGERVVGDPPFPDMASLGGRYTLPGYRADRFIGDGAASASSLLRLTLFRLGSAGGLGFGVHGLGTMGRVWLDDVPESNTIHSAWGGGLFIRSEGLRRSVSITWARGERGTRTYVRLGFPF